MSGHTRTGTDGHGRIPALSSFRVAARILDMTPLAMLALIEAGVLRVIQWPGDGEFYITSTTISAYMAGEAGTKTVEQCEELLAAARGWRVAA